MFTISYSLIDIIYSNTMCTVLRQPTGQRRYNIIPKFTSINKCIVSAVADLFRTLVGHPRAFFWGGILNKVSDIYITANDTLQISTTT